MKARRGVSEILATMIVLMIVSSLGVMLYNISTSNLNSQQSNLISQVNNQEETVKEKFDIISITRMDPNTVLIYYTNYGDVSPVISAVYFECSGRTPGQSTQLLTQVNPPTRSVKIDNQSSNIYYLTVSLPDSITNSYYVTYKLVSQRGNSIESQG